MADTYVIDTVFKAHDQMTSTVSKVTDRMNLFGRSSDRNFKKATASALKFKTVLGGVLGANLITAGMNQLRMGVGAVTKEFIDFDHAVTSAASKWDVDRGTKAFKDLGATVRDVAKVTPFTAGEAGQGLDYLAMAGFTMQDAMKALPGVTQLAIATQTDLAQASDIASDALSSLGLKVEDLTHVNDVFAKTTTTSNTNLEMLFESMKLVAPVASGLGGNVSDLSAMIGTLANSGIKASMSGTALRNMYLRLTSGTSEVEKVLKKYKIQVVDSNGKMRNMIDILEDVRQKTRKLKDDKKQEAYTSLFGARAVASATVLMNKGSKALHEYSNSLETANGAAAKMAERMGKSWQNRIASLKSRLVELGLKIFDTFEKEIPQAFNTVEKWLEQFDGEEFKRWIIDVKNEVKPLVVGFFDLVKQGGKLIDWLRESGVTWKQAAIAFGGWKLAVMALNTALMSTKTTLGGLVAAKGFGLIKTVAATMGVAGGAIAGAGALGAYTIGSNLVKGQDEAHSRLAERKRINKLNKTESIVDKSFSSIKDKTLRDLAKQRYQETGIVPEAMQKTFSFMGRGPIFSSTDIPGKSVLEVEIKSPFDVNTKIKQDKNGPAIKANKKSAPSISGDLGKN